MDLQKNILEQIQSKKDLLCTDLNISSLLNLTSYTIQSGDTSDNTAVLITVTPSEIIEANETQIILNNITFKTPDTIEGTPPNQTITPGDTIICNEPLIIPLNSEIELGLDYRSLVGRKVNIISSDSINFNINSGNIIINQDINISYALIKDIELETIFNNFIISLNTENPKMLTRFDFPTNNEFFKKYDDFTDVFIGYKSCYKNETDVNGFVGEINEFLSIDIDSLITKDDFLDYYNNYISKISIITTQADNWSEYFKRLKKLMSKMKISDAMVDEEDCVNLYDSKPLLSRNDIDTMYDVYINNNREVYVDHKQELLYEIKID